MARTNLKPALGGEPFPATARLRAELLIAPDLDTLVGLFTHALEEYGINGHFCLVAAGTSFTPLVGDRPDLIGRPADCLVIDSSGGFVADSRMLLALPMGPLSAEHQTRLRGYAQLYAARAIALQELADDVETDCGLSLRERYVLGRRLAGLAAVDISVESGLAVETVGAAIESAILRLGADGQADAISFAARRGWLAVTSLENCTSSSGKLSYNGPQSGF